MDAIGIDIACMFPTPMLNLRCRPASSRDRLARAYNRWLCERVLQEEPRIKSLLYLPFNDPEAAYKMIEDFGGKKGVIGFTVTSPHYKSRLRQRLYEDLRGDRGDGLPLVFHSATWRRAGASRCATASSPCMRWASAGTTSCTDQLAR